MPSAANVKIDKQVSSENSLAESSGNLSPLRQAVTIIEHKIRNLEKRKSKLESYKELQNAGKELNADQKTAVAKFNEVMSTLDFARDLCKQFVGIASVTEKEAKKLAKKEAAAKYQAELARLREILLVQDALNQMGNESVRDDFLHGRNGASKLSESDLKLLDDLYPAVTPKHEIGNPTAFANEVQAAAEHLLSTVDGKQKEAFGGTYSQIKEILGKIHESGYFDQSQVVFEDYVEAPVVEPEVEGAAAEAVTNHESPVVESQPVIQMVPVPKNAPLEYRYPDTYPPLILTPQSPIVQRRVPTPEYFMPPEGIVENPVVEHETAPLPPKPLAEFLSSGRFFFLQESEIDNSPIDQEQHIQSQTFINQNFDGVQGKPVPPTMTHFVPQPPLSFPSPVEDTDSPPNNGIDGELGHTEEQNLVKDATPPVNQELPKPANSQSYYQNNNGYNNRPRHHNPGTRNNGPRPANRHN